ncbi:MAG TPA: flagellar motor protein MotB [Acidobacteriaceae bacterium]|nr:flagellar motor protein MotB [Acidobacteriaceae bacterium]
MRKKRTGRVSHDRWLVSYADFITLLFAFFVVLFATSQSDKHKKAELATSIQSAFSEMGIFQPRSAQARLRERVGAAGGAMAPDLDWHHSMSEDALLSVEQRIEQSAQREIASGILSVHESADGLVISLEEAGFFDSGAAEIRPAALPVLDRIAAALPGSTMRIEGHTDNVPIHTAQFASNWELSSGRASSIARLLLLHANVHADRLSVAGYAEFHPAASNATPEGRARNRRVDIILLRESTE